MDRIDVTKPSPARVYDYLLGGTHHYVVDRRHAEEFLAVWPTVADNAIANRAFMQKAVRQASNDGVDQFLDLGSGLPTAENVHQIAQRTNPCAGVVYCDLDPSAVAHGKTLLEDTDRAWYLGADIADSGTVLGEAEQLLDFTRPVALLCTAVLHYLPDDPAKTIAPYISALAPGSYVVVSHATDEGAPAELKDRMGAIFGGGFHMRPIEQIRRVFDGLEVLDPGLADVQMWSADGPVELPPQRLVGAIARKP